MNINKTLKLLGCIMDGRKNKRVSKITRGSASMMISRFFMHVSIQYLILKDVALICSQIWMVINVINLLFSA
jgi:hypothetical protein